MGLFKTMKWIGLTGGIATGKSSVARLIESRSYKVIDADHISHRLTKVGMPAYDHIIQTFGEEILQNDLQLDRKKLGQIIFENSEKKIALESILHPLIQEEVQVQKQRELQKGAHMCFYDVPLLFEKNLETQFDEVWVVWCDFDTQIDRLKKRNNLTVEEALLRINNQWPLPVKVKKADYCIDNSTDEISLIKIVDKFLGF